MHLAKNTCLHNTTQSTKLQQSPVLLENKPLGVPTPALFAAGLEQLIPGKRSANKLAEKPPA
jgi:hypothetical protein